MSAASNYLEASIAEFIFRGGSVTQPTELYVALFTTLPGEDNVGGVEPVATSYSRAQHNPSTTNWSAPVAGNGIVTNSTAIIFNSPTEDWGTILGYGIYDQLGNLLVLDTISTPETVNSGDPAPVFSPGAISIAIA